MWQNMRHFYCVCGFLLYHIIFYSILFYVLKIEVAHKNTYYLCFYWHGKCLKCFWYKLLFWFQWTTICKDRHQTRPKSPGWDNKTLTMQCFIYFKSKSGPKCLACSVHCTLKEKTSLRLCLFINTLLKYICKEKVWGDNVSSSTCKYYKNCTSNTLINEMSMPCNGNIWPVTFKKYLVNIILV